MEAQLDDDGEWIPLGAAAAVGPGERVPAVVGDEDLVVWRTFDGQPCALLARCPHGWAHLGYEGTVDGDELVCAAHFWRFRPDGSASKLAMSGRRDPKGATVAFRCRERSGQLEVRWPLAEGLTGHLEPPEVP